MTCLSCAQRSQLYLCGHCCQRLDGYLDNLPWLLEQLDITLRRQDHLTAGSLGGKSMDTPAPINFDALEVAQNARKVLANAVRTLLQSGDDVLVCRGADTAQYCEWLSENRRRIPRSMLAGELLADLRDLVDEDRGDGVLVVAINRNERRYYGPCTHVVGRDRRGRPRECGADLYALRDVDMLTCPECHVSVSAQVQLDQTEARSDLRTMDMLIDTMRALGETVGRNRVQQWINTGRLERRGYYNRDRGIVPKRIRAGDPAVYSLEEARELRAQSHRPKAQATG